MKAAYDKRKVNRKTGRQAAHYKCEHCGKSFIMTQMDRDHIEPVIDPAVGFQSWDEVVRRMYREDNWQALCKPCHKKKTAAERKVADERRKHERDKERGA
jgi:5-methylcytosine-specific restriction endonuclease McrA